MSTTPSYPSPARQLHATGERALVLGGGGSAGNAWLIGVIAGLYEAGLDVTDADLTIGTSAGSTAAAQLSGAKPADLYAAILDAAPPPPTGSEVPRSATHSAADQMARTAAIIAEAANPADMRRKLGAAALELAAAADSSWSRQWRTTVAARFPNHQWPERTIYLTAVDARTGNPVVFDRLSGIELIDAVAASCASGPPYFVGEHRFLDGGYRRNENADLALGFRRVLVLSPLGGRTRTPLAWGMQLAAQIDELRSGGSTVQTIVPDEDSLRAFGDNLMDPSTRPPAARGGYRQGRSLAETLTGFWRQ